MIPVAEIMEEAQQITGNDRQDFLFKRITDAVELLANKGEFDPTRGYLDICVSSCIVALPPEVETPIACNMAGNPAVPRDELFKFHLNGPGEGGPTLEWEWVDQGDACVYRELTKPSKLIGAASVSSDNNSEMWAYGYDENQNWIRTKVDDTTFVEGWKVPTFYLTGALPADAPLFSRITRIRRAPTNAPTQLSTLDGIKLAVYQPWHTEPQFRKIRLSQPVPWVRIAYRKRVFKVTSEFDLLPVNNSQAVLMMLRAIQLYPKDPATAETLESTAVRWATEEQHTSNPPVMHPIEVHDLNGLNDQVDYLD